jgi:hypothetical protein
MERFIEYAFLSVVKVVLHNNPLEQPASLD